MLELCSPRDNIDNTDTFVTWYDVTVLRMSLLSAFIGAVSICGLVGNGAVIWLLSFRIKRNPFTIYILNLAIADFGVLIVSTSMAVTTFLDIFLDASNLFHELHDYGSIVSEHLSLFFYSISQFLLTAISIDRCVSVLFPLWYRCHRPKNFSTVLCVLIWFFTLVIHGIYLSVQYSGSFTTDLPQFIVILVNAVVCLPLITVSTLILFFKFCFKSQQRQRGKLLTAILLTLFFFLIFAFPLNVIILVYYSPWSDTVWIILHCNNIPDYGWFCASLNSFVNPLLYFLVGRKERGFCRENPKRILRRVFTEEEEACRGEPGIQLSDH